MHEKYAFIIESLKNALENGNKRKIKFWENKLKIWQVMHDSYSPIRP